jgi:hypothetical protein
MSFQHERFMARLEASQQFCNPAAWYVAAVVISGIGTTASIQGQRANQIAQENYQKETVKANNKVSYEQMSALRIQQSEDAESRARENEKARLISQRAASTAATAAGEAGVSGASVDALLGEYQMQFGQFRESTLRQGQFYASGVDAQIDAIRSGAGMSNLQINAPVSRPNYAAAVAQFGSDSLGAYRAYKGSTSIGSNTNTRSIRATRDAFPTAVA